MPYLSEREGEVLLRGEVEGLPRGLQTALELDGDNIDFNPSIRFFSVCYDIDFNLFGVCDNIDFKPSIRYFLWLGYIYFTFSSVQK